MARILKEEQHAVKRNEILDVTQRLVYTHGYAQMSIQEIINELQISKGAFYHYFGSKQALLESLIERTLDQAMQILCPIVEDAHLPALEKINHFFLNTSQWKITQKAYMLAMLNIWYADDNAIMRQKVQAETVRRIAPLFTRIVRQGIVEGVFSSSFPEHVGEIIFSLLLGYGEICGGLLIQLGLGGGEQQEEILERGDGLRQIVSLTAAYTGALERILGAPAGSLIITDITMLEAWLD